MSGSSRALTFVNLTSVRIAGAPSYTPAHIPAGADKPLSARATFNVMANNGDKTFTFPCTAWGKLADALSRGGAKGKELTVYGELRSHRAKVWVPGMMPNGVMGRIPFQNPDGTFLMQSKVSIVVQRFNFGNDSDKTVAEEIAQGMRPQMWNVAGHADSMAWKNECQRRNSLQYQQGMTHFGYAEVFVPNNAQIVNPDYNQANNAGTAQTQGGGYQGQQYAGNTGAVQQGFNQAGVQQNQGGYQQQQVANQMSQGQMGGYVQQGQQTQGAPVEVNGQHMGYAMNQGAPNTQSGYQPQQGGAPNPNECIPQQNMGF